MKKAVLIVVSVVFVAASMLYATEGAFMTAAYLQSGRLPNHWVGPGINTSLIGSALLAWACAGLCLTIFIYSMKKVVRE